MYRLFELFVHQFSGNPIFSNLFIFETDQSSYSFPIETQQFLFSGRLEISSLQSIFNYFLTSQGGPIKIEYLK